jgi:DNA Polymerase alpha zinc finger
MKSLCGEVNGLLLLLRQLKQPWNCQVALVERAVLLFGVLQDGSHPASASSSEFGGPLVREMTESYLYTQLSYMSNLLDVSKALRRVKGEEAQAAAKENILPLYGALNAAYSEVQHLQGRSKYGFVNLAALLAGPVV